VCKKNRSPSLNKFKNAFINKYKMHDLIKEKISEESPGLTPKRNHSTNISVKSSQSNK